MDFLTTAHPTKFISKKILISQVCLFISAEVIWYCYSHRQLSLDSYVSSWWVSFGNKPLVLLTGGLIGHICAGALGLWKREPAGIQSCIPNWSAYSREYCYWSQKEFSSGGEEEICTSKKKIVCNGFVVPGLLWAAYVCASVANISTEIIQLPHLLCPDCNPAGMVTLLCLSGS